MCTWLLIRWSIPLSITRYLAFEVSETMISKRRKWNWKTKVNLWVFFQEGSSVGTSLGSVIKNPLSSSLLSCHRSHGFDPWVGKIPWRRKWQSAPVLLPGISHGHGLVGYSPWGCKDSDTTEHVHSFDHKPVALQWGCFECSHLYLSTPLKPFQHLISQSLLDQSMTCSLRLS